MDALPATLPQEWGALLALVFVLGMKHGFDADHLATIDGLTRFNARQRPALARYCGSLFSLGHGGVVVGLALAVSTLASSWQVPAWMETFGALTSIAILLGLGLVNLLAVVRAAPDDMVHPVGWRSGLLGRFFARFQRTGNPLAIAGIGALFALSFDTLSQATLFALSASQFGGWQHALLLGLLFMLGMLLTDGVNGLWIAQLIRRADEAARIASRVMSLVVGGVSLLVAAFGIAKFASPFIETWSEGKELAFGLALVAVIAASFVLSLRLARRVGGAFPG
jgi:nickel/cobalt transporter (NiCoT) family protein